MNKLLLLILLFNIVKATFICKCKSSTNCDDINIDDCMPNFYSPGISFRLNGNEDFIKSTCELYNTNYCVKQYKIDVPIPDNRNDNIYFYGCIVDFNRADIKCLTNIYYYIKDQRIYDVFSHRHHDAFNYLGFNIQAEIEYSNMKLINLPDNQCGFYISLAIKVLDYYNSHSISYDFHDGYEYVVKKSSMNKLEPYGYSIKYTCYTRKHQNIDNNKITKKLQEENQQLKEYIQNLKNRIENVVNCISV